MEGRNATLDVDEMEYQKGVEENCFSGVARLNLQKRVFPPDTLGLKKKGGLI